MKTYAGIDPGKGGWLAAITGSECSLYQLPYEGRDLAISPLVGILLELDPALVVIEKQQAMRKGGRTQGVASTAMTMLNYGRIEGAVIGSAACPYSIVGAKVWKKMLGGSRDKAAAIAFARQHYPKTSLRRTSRCRKDDHNIADAICIAHFGKTCSEG